MNEQKPPAKPGILDNDDRIALGAKLQELNDALPPSFKEKEGFAEEFKKPYDQLLAALGKSDADQSLIPAVGMFLQEVREAVEEHGKSLGTPDPAVSEYEATLDDAIKSVKDIDQKYEGLSISPPSGASKTPPTPDASAKSADGLKKAKDADEKEEPFHIDPLRAFLWNQQDHSRKLYEAAARFNDELFDKKTGQAKKAFQDLNENNQKVALEFKRLCELRNVRPPDQILERMGMLLRDTAFANMNPDAHKKMKKEFELVEQELKEYKKCEDEAQKRSDASPSGVYIERVKNSAYPLSRRGFVMVNEKEGSIQSDSDWVVPYKETLRMGKAKGLFKDFDNIYVEPQIDPKYFNVWNNSSPSTYIEARNYVRRVTTALNENLYPEEDLKNIRANFSSLTKWQKTRLAEALAGYEKRKLAAGQGEDKSYAAGAEQSKAAARTQVAPKRMAIGGPDVPKMNDGGQALPRGRIK